MTFADIPAGTSVFVDANTFVYHFVPHPTFQLPCQHLLERIARQEILGYTTADLVSDVAHRVMTMEAVIRFGWPMKGIAQRLQQHRAHIALLSQFRLAVDEIPRFGIQVLPVHLHHVSAAAAISQQAELLSGDALVVAVMRDHGLVHLASADVDFDSVPGLTRYGPV